MPCVYSRVRFGGATGSIVQDFELTFSPLSTGVLPVDAASAVDDQAAAIYDPHSTIWTSSGSMRTDYYHPTCSVLRETKASPSSALCATAQLELGASGATAGTVTPAGDHEIQSGGLLWVPEIMKLDPFFWKAHFI